LVFHGYGFITGHQGFPSYTFGHGIDLSRPASGMFLLQWKIKCSTLILFLRTDM
jgi:hypothetical protein